MKEVESILKLVTDMPAARFWAVQVLLRNHNFFPKKIKGHYQMSKTENLIKSLVDSAYEVGCDGLVNRTAYSLEKGKKHHAEQCSKEDGPFFCKKCMSDAVLKKCSNKVDHFAHKAPLTPAISKGESDLHMQCKNEIRDALNLLYPEGDWQTERHIEANEKKETELFIPDVSGKIGNQRIGIEVQISAYPISKFIKKTELYAKWKLPVLWIVPLKKELTKGVFRPRLYERYFHSLYGGRVYYWWKGRGITLSPVSFGVQKRYIKSSEFFDVEAGSMKSFGGYEKDYLNIKYPIFSPDIQLDSDFSLLEQEEYFPENEKFKIPHCFLWKDKL